MEGIGQKKEDRTGAAIIKLPIRRLASWHESFLQYTERLPSPYLFRKWAAIYTIAGALERKVWVRSLKSNLYPNLYIILVALPGVGKTILTNQIHNLLSELPDHHLASSSVTAASLIDELRGAERRLVKPSLNPPVLSFNSLSIVSNELGVMLSDYDASFMNRLTDIYDCHHYSERRRTKDLHFEIKAPQINLIAATTPSYLNGFMPEGAWDQGFISRVILIYSGEQILSEIFAEDPLEEEVDPLFKDLIHDLKIIGDLYGKMEVTKDVKIALTKWHMEKGPPQPDHPRLLHYSTRRTAHLIKLCMIASASTSSELIITKDHYDQAMDWLIEAETYMPDIFKAMSTGGDRRAIDETWHFAYTKFMKDKKPIPEHLIVHFLQERTPAHNVARILDVMVRARMLEGKMDSAIGKCYVPRARRS